MKQADLNRSVAQATGETVTVIKRLGFFLVEPDTDVDAESDVPEVIDWDALDRRRYDHNFWGPRDEPANA